ncbi:MAG: FixH family protein [Bdellovibrionota bacterium]
MKNPVIFSFLLLSSLAACAPMNDKPASLLNANNKTECQGGTTDAIALDSGEAVALSNKKAFVISAALHPQLGDNLFAFRLAQGKSLATNSKDSVVTVHYTRPESHVPHDNVVTADRAEDGSYTAKLTLNKHGRWEVHVQITEGDTQDDRIFGFTF